MGRATDNQSLSLYRDGGGILGLAAQEAIPLATDDFTPKKPIARVREQKISGPMLERAGEPLRERNGESHFLAVDQCPRHVLVKDLSEDPLAMTVAHFQASRKPP